MNYLRQPSETAATREVVRQPCDVHWNLAGLSPDRLRATQKAVRFRKERLVSAPCALRMRTNSEPPLSRAALRAMRRWLFIREDLIPTIRALSLINSPNGAITPFKIFSLYGLLDSAATRGTELRLGLTQALGTALTRFPVPSTLLPTVLTIRNSSLPSAGRTEI